MKTETIKILDRLAEALKAEDGSLASDYRIAKVLGISKGTTSAWRVGRGSFSDDTALRIAEILNENPAYLLAVSQAERTQSEPARRVYLEMAKKFRGAAAVLLLFSTGALVSEQSYAATLGNGAKSFTSMYIMLRRAFRARLGRFAEAC